MANPEHLEILKQGVEAWNRWRGNNPDVKPDLSSADLGKFDLDGVNFRRANFRNANLQKAILENADLSEATFSNVNFFEAILNKADISKSDLRGAIFDRSDLIESNLSGSNLCRSSLIKTDFEGSNLERSVLEKSVLNESNLVNANLSNCCITGALLYGTALEDWKIDGIKCDYVFWDRKGEVRTPKDRDFHLGEFEKLYKSLPSFEYYFERGFTPFDAVVMDQVVTAVNKSHPEFDLKLDSFHSRGLPHAKFTVLHKENIEEVRKQVASEYEGRLKYIEGQRDQILELFTKTINEPRTVIGQVTGSVSVNKKEIEHMSGDTFKVSNVSGANINLKSHMENIQQNIVNAIQKSDASDDLKAKLEELAKAVEAMIGEMPKDQAKEVKDNLELFVKGATENKPKWYSVSGVGLIDAAKAVGSLGKPVVELAQSVLKLLP